MPALLPCGSELWFLFYDRETDGYVPRCVGKIEETSTRYGYRVGREWHQAAFPHFGSKPDAEAYIAKHPHAVPTIK